MSNLSERINNIVISCAVGMLALVGNQVLFAQSLPQEITPSESLPMQSSPYDSNSVSSLQPRRLSINVAINSPNDLKVRENDIIQAGQIIADREQERLSLESQKDQLLISMKRIENSKILEPITPQSVPPVPNLPPANFSQEEAQIAQAQLQLQQAQRMYEFALSNNPFVGEQANVEKAMAEAEAAATVRDNQTQKVNAISQLQGLPPEVRVHEAQKLKLAQLEEMRFSSEYNFKVAELEEAKQEREERLKTLQNNVEKAQAALSLANARLQTARNQRAELEYNHSITTARRIEESNQAQQFYSRQMAEYNQNLQDQEFRLTGLQEKLNNVEIQLSALSVVRSPYSGKIRRIKQERQENGLLYVEVVLVPNSSNSTTSPE